MWLCTCKFVDFSENINKGMYLTKGSSRIHHFAVGLIVHNIRFIWYLLTGWCFLARVLLRDVVINLMPNPPFLPWIGTVINFRRAIDGVYDKIAILFYFKVCTSQWMLWSKYEEFSMTIINGKTYEIYDNDFLIYLYGKFIHLYGFMTFWQ